MALANTVRGALALFLLCASIPAQGELSSASALIARYETLKVAVERWFEANYSTPHSAVSATASGGNTTPQDTIQFSGNLDLFEPEPSTWRYGDRASQTEDELLRLAQTMGMLRAQLRSAGYPPEIYDEQIRQFELRAAQAIAAGEDNPIHSGNAMEALITEIEEARKESDPTLPPVTYVQVANYIALQPIVLRSKPVGGRVWVISQLRFEVCRLSVPNPFDTEKCRQWREADERQPLYLAGTYAFQVRWPDGRNATGQRTIYNDGGDTAAVYDLP